MARAIDASHFGEIMEQWKKDCLECDDQHGADVIIDVILQLDDMPTLTQPNEPLTLDELRESPHGKIKDSTLESICNRANEIASRPPEGEDA